MKHPKFIIAVLVIIFVFSVAGFAWLNWYFKSTQNETNLVLNIALPSVPILPPEEPQTALFLYPNPLNVIPTQANSPLSIDVKIDAGQNLVTKVVFELSFPPNALENIDLTDPTTQNRFFDNPQVTVKRIDPISGKISYTIQDMDGKPQTGSGTLAVIVFSLAPKTQKPTVLYFADNSTITAQGIPGSALKIHTGATIIISNQP